MAKILRGVYGANLAAVKENNAGGQFCDFFERVRSKQKRGAMTAEDFRFEKLPEVSGSERVQAARGLVEKKDRGRMNEGACQSEALKRAGGICPGLAVERIAQAEKSRKLGHSLLDLPTGKVVQCPKQTKVFAAGEATVEALFDAGVVANMAACARGVAGDVGAADFGAAARGNEKRGQNAQQCGFSGAVFANQRHRFPWINREGDARKRTQRWAGKGVQ